MTGHRLPLTILLITSVLACAVPLSAATCSDATLVAHSNTGASLRIAVPDSAAAWQALVAVPPGRTARLTTSIAGVSLGEPAIMHGVSIAPLLIAGGAQAGRELDVDLVFATQEGRPAAPRPRMAATFARLLAAQAVGGDAVRAQVTEVPGTYLMIVSSAPGALDAVAPLLTWRRQQGYAVQVATLLETGDTAAQIKSYIQQVYDDAEAPLAYVSLVGDATGTVSVPTYRESVSGYHGEGDHYYVQLDGDDVLADAHVGRISARSVDELEGMVAKILAYERTPPTWSDPGWYHRAVLVGDSSSSGATTIYVNQWLKEQLLGLGYTQIDTIWSGPFATQIFNKLNQGASVYAYRGYLNCSGFNTGYIDALSNGGELPFAVMPTCASGSFASDIHSYSEAMLRNPGGGAIGAVGTATTGTHTRYNNCYFHGVWEGALNEPDRHLGYAHTRGKLELYRQYQAHEPNIVEIWSVWNNLMGDPATEMRQNLALSTTVTYPSEVPSTAGAVPVQVTRAGSGVVGARVALSREGEVQVAGWTDDQGEVLLLLPESVAPGSVAVTVTGDDLIPHQGQLLVGATTAYCVAVGWIWNDGEDGMPDPGEVATLDLQVRNLGQSAASQVTVELASRREGVEVAGTAVIAGDIPPGETVPVGSWTVTLPDDLPDAADVMLAVTATATQPEATWQSRADLPISAPAFVLQNVSWSGLPGQVSALEVTVRNVGSEPALAAVASLAPGSDFLLAAGSLVAPLGDVLPFSGAEASYLLAVTDDAWGGHLANAFLTITTAAGTSQVLPLPLATGSLGLDSPVGPGTMGYVAWDDLDPVADAPQYQWRELDPDYFGSGNDVGLSDFGYEQDDTRTVDLPFVFTFRGREYDQVSICSNGWVALGQTYLVHYRNWSLPTAGAPDPLLAVFWDDLEQFSSNRVYHQYLPDEGLYVVQWSRMRNSHNGLQNCQLLLFDPVMHPTATGDGLIVFQYDLVNNNDSSRGYATTGIQDGDDGLTWTYYNSYAAGARGLQQGRAIAFVPTAGTVAGMTAVSPGSLEAVLAPGETRDVTLSIANIGPAGSVASWQLALRDMVDEAAKVETARDRTVTVVAPNGGETWTVNEQRVISWEASTEVSTVNVRIDRGGAAGWETIATDRPADAGYLIWTVSGPTSPICRIRVVDTDDLFVVDDSDGNFAITVDFNWLSLAETSGRVAAGETAPVVVTFDATVAVPGVYVAEIVVMSSGGDPVVVPVTLTVREITSAPDLPVTTALAQNAPNPFNPVTTIRFGLPAATIARLTVHDLRGRLVRTLHDGTIPAGVHQVVFDGLDDRGRALASSTYVYRLTAGRWSESRRMTLVR